MTYVDVDDLLVARLIVCMGKFLQSTGLINFTNTRLGSLKVL